MTSDESIAISVPLFTLTPIFAVASAIKNKNNYILKSKIEIRK